MSYRFDGLLVPSVLADQQFRSTGLYRQLHGRPNVSVWVKVKSIPPLNSPTDYCH